MTLDDRVYNVAFFRVNNAIEAHQNDAAISDMKDRQSASGSAPPRRT